MRIFLAIESFTNALVPGNRIWHWNLYEPLLELGHEVVLYSTRDGWRAMQRQDAKAREVFSQEMLNTFRREHAKKAFDLFFGYLMEGMVVPEVIDDIRRSGALTCNFSCNNAHQFSLVEKIAQHFDICLHSEKDVSAKFLDVGASPIWFPMAANPKYYRPYDVPRVIDVAFVGLCYARRPYYIWHLLEHGVDVKLWGPGWSLKPDKLILRKIVRWARRNKLALNSMIAWSPEERHCLSGKLCDIDILDRLRKAYGTNLGNPLSDTEMICKYSEAKISLGFLEVLEEHSAAGRVKQHIHLREFEAPMCGALYFTGWCEEIAEFYEPDKEIVVYRNEHELLDKVQYYLSHPIEGEKIREAGRNRALKEHTYTKRFENLFKELKIA